MIAQRYPLDWPQGYQRTYRSQSSNPSRPLFKQISLTLAVGLIREEVRKLQGKSWRLDPEVQISSNIPLRNDGEPRADYARSVISDPGVAVYFTYNKEPVVLCCDKYSRIEDNMKAIAITIEDMRRIERNGVSDFIKRSFTGFKALPAASFNWWTVLAMSTNGIPDPTPSMAHLARLNFRALSKKYHPDTGELPNPRLFQEVVEAWEQAQKHFSNIINKITR